MVDVSEKRAGAIDQQDSDVEGICSQNVTVLSGKEEREKSGSSDTNKDNANALKKNETRVRKPEAEKMENEKQVLEKGSDGKRELKELVDKAGNDEKTGEKKQKKKKERSKKINKGGVDSTEAMTEQGRAKVFVEDSSDGLFPVEDLKRKERERKEQVRIEREKIEHKMKELGSSRQQKNMQDNSSSSKASLSAVEKEEDLDQKKSSTSSSDSTSSYHFLDDPPPFNRDEENSDQANKGSERSVTSLNSHTTESCSLSQLIDIDVDSDTHPAPLLPNTLALRAREKSHRKVKVYVLNEDGTWDDRSTGYALCIKSECKKTERGTDLIIQVYKEDSDSVALNYRVKNNHDALYNLQGSTIITWNERNSDATGLNLPSPLNEMALSFAEPKGCKEVWEAILKAQTHASSIVHQKKGPPGAHNSFLIGPTGALLDEEPDISAATAMTYGGRNADDPLYGDVSVNSLTCPERVDDLFADCGAPMEVNIPEPTHTHLVTLASIFSDQGPLHITPVRQGVAAEFKKHNYVSRLLDLFRECEDLGSFEQLRYLFYIFRGICFLGDIELLDECLSEKNFIRVIGTMEYDPTYLPKIPEADDEKKKVLDNLIPLRRNRNAFLARPTFQSVVDIEDSNILKKIHHNYRLMFIRDVVLPHTMDDLSMGSFQGYLHMNNMDIITYLLEEKRPLQHLFEQFHFHMRDTNEQEGQKDLERNGVEGKTTMKSVHDLRTLLHFVMELLNVTRFVQPQVRTWVLARLISMKLLDVLSFAIQEKHEPLQQAATDVLLEICRTEYGMIEFHKYILGRDTRDHGPSPESSITEVGDGESVISSAGSEEEEEESESSFDLPKEYLAEEKGPSASYSASRSRNKRRPRKRELGLIKRALDEEANIPVAIPAEPRKLLMHLFDMLCHHEHLGLVLQVNDIIRQVAMPEVLSFSPERKRLLKHIYSKCAPRLLAFLNESARKLSIKPGSHDSTFPRLANLPYICDTLSFFISVHGHRAKYFVLGNNLVGRALKFIRHPVGDVRLSLIRLVRHVIGVKDGAYDRYLKLNRLLKPVMKLFAENNHKDNIVSSSVLEMVDFCTREHREELLSLFLENFGDILRGTTEYSQVFPKAQEMLGLLRSNNAPKPDVVHIASHVPRSSPRVSFTPTDTLTLFPTSEEEEYLANSEMSDILSTKSTEASPRRLSLGSHMSNASHLLSSYDDDAIMEESSPTPRPNLSDSSVSRKDIMDETKTLMGIIYDTMEDHDIGKKSKVPPKGSSTETLSTVFPDSDEAKSKVGKPTKDSDEDLTARKKRPRTKDLEDDVQNEEDNVDKKKDVLENPNEKEKSPVSSDGSESPTKKRRLSEKRNRIHLTATSSGDRKDSPGRGASPSHEARLQSPVATALAET